MAMRELVAIACIVLASCSCSRTPAPVDPPMTAIAALPAVPAGDPMEGLRIATRVGCTGCHEKDGRGGGFDESTPQGDRVVAPNLTQRRQMYDDAGLAALLHEGRTHDGHRPFGMPIQMFQHLSDREVRDITAWLRALPAVDNPGLAESRITPATMKQLLDGTHPYSGDDRPDPGNVPPPAPPPPTKPLVLGKHLALTTCSECHGWDLDGFDGDDAPSLIVAKAYTPEQFVRLMRTGEIATGGKSRTGFMSKTATYRFAATLTDAEIAALKQYLDSR